MKINVCVEPIPAYGEHVRFTPEEHIEILLLEREAMHAQDLPYKNWEEASRSINWFDGPKPVSLSYVKRHMPRAMLLSMSFPADRNPHVVQADLDLLLKAEKEYNEAAKTADSLRAYALGLAKKYNVGPTLLYDKDMGGVTPQDGCGKWEEREWEPK